MGMAILKGTDGVSVIRLPSGGNLLSNQVEWSAPCAISLESVANTVAPQQETVLLFMSEVAIYSLVTRANVALNQTHRFEPGPFGPVKGNECIDIYVYVRFNGGFTPSDLIAVNMVGWIVKEDTDRHTKWHGDSVTWFDVLTNKISVDRSSVGNALYVVLNLGAGSSLDQSRLTKKNYADVESWVNVAPSFKKSVPQSIQSGVDYTFLPNSQIPYNNYQAPQMNQMYMPMPMMNQANQSPSPYELPSQYQSSSYPTAPMHMYGQPQPYQGQNQPQSGHGQGDAQGEWRGQNSGSGDGHHHQGYF
jgi:hypothetical protein